MSTDLKVLKLVNGDNIIGIVEENISDEEKQYKHLLFLKYVLQIHKTYDKKKKHYNLYMTDWIPECSDDILTIAKSTIITLAHPTPEIEDLYYESTLPDLDEREGEMKKSMTDDELELIKQRKKLLNHEFSDDDVQ